MLVWLLVSNALKPFPLLSLYGPLEETRWSNHETWLPLMDQELNYKKMFIKYNVVQFSCVMEFVTIRLHV
jgi:hypothetical protein